MRTLIDLINTDHGYARIFADPAGYSYELYVYQPTPVADLFESLGGYASAADACEAASQQLSAVYPRHRSKARKAAPSRKRSAEQATRSVIQGSIGLL
jgi:hypothetical protein